MEFLALLGFVGGLIAFYSLFIQPFVVYSLISRINHLEDYLKKSTLNQKESQTQKPHTIPSSSVPFLNTLKPIKLIIPLEESHIEIPDPEKPTFTPDQISTPFIVSETPSKQPFNIFDWLKQDFFVKLGGIFVLLAASWFASLLFANDVIGPTGRILLGVVAGLILLAGGYWQMEKRTTLSYTLVGTGASSIIASIWSGRVIFDLYSPEITFAGMVLTLILTAIIAIMHKKESIAVTTLLGAYLIPFLTGTTNPSSQPLFTYLLILTLSVFAVSYFRQWRSLQTISIVAISLFSSLFYLDKTLNVWLFILSFGGVFYLTSLLNAFRSKTILDLDVVNSLLATLITNIWIISFVDKPIQVPALLGSSIISFAVSILFNQKGSMGKFTLIQIVSSLTTFFLAIYLQFQSQPLVLALLISTLLVAVQYLLSLLFKSTLPYRILPWFHIVSLGFFEQWLFQKLVFNQEYLALFTSNTELANTTIRQPLVLQSIYAMIVLGGLIFFNAIIIKRTVKKPDTLQSLVISLLNCGGILYGFGIILQMFEIIVNKLGLQAEPYLLNIAPQIMLAFFMVISWFTATTHLNKDPLLRWFGWILLCISSLYLFVFLSSTIQPYSFIYLGILFLISLAITHLSKQSARSEITLYSIALASISFAMQFFSSTNQGDTYKAMFYLLYIPMFLILILHPFFQKTKAEEFLSVFYKIGMAFLLFALVFFEFWQLGVVIRIIIFITIGLLFIATGFFKKK
jgi:hypothetical protein